MGSAIDDDCTFGLGHPVPGGHVRGGDGRNALGRVAPLPGVPIAGTGFASDFLEILELTPD